MVAKKPEQLEKVIEKVIRVPAKVREQADSDDEEEDDDDDSPKVVVILYN